MAEKSFSPVRVRAATQEAAITQALQMTGASREEIEVEVLEESDKSVTIRIAPQGTLAAKTPTAEDAAAPVESTPTPAASDEEQAPEQTQESEEEPAPERAAEEDDAPDENASALDESAVPSAREVRPAPEVRTAAPEVAEHARVLAQEMLGQMGLEAEAKSGELPAWCLPTAHDKSERVRDVPRAFLQIEGEDVGILIGKHGQTLQSFQYLLNLSLNNITGDEEATEEGVRDGGVHVVVDAGEYRGRRAGALERQAQDAASRAKRDRRSIRMEPMPGHERRLVHLALYEDEEITTTSDGREPWRRVIVTPAGMTPSTGRSGGRGGDRYGNDRSGGNRNGGSGGGRRSGGGYGGGGGYGSQAGNAGGSRRSYN